MPRSGSHRRLYTFSPSDYPELSGIWVVVARPRCRTIRRANSKWSRELQTGGKIHNLTGVPSAFTPDYAPEEMFEIASKLYKKSR